MILQNFLCTKELEKVWATYPSRAIKIFTGLSVKENILSVLEMMGNNKSSQIRKCNFLISEFKLDKVKDSIGSTSGGERRRTEIARALALIQNLYC